MSQPMHGLLIPVLCVLSVVVTASGAAEHDGTKLESASWLAGRWQSAAGEQVACEEHWSTAAGGAMVGMFRLVNSGRPVVYELLLIEQETDGVWMRLRHFRPQMVALEQKPIKIKLVSASPEKLVFENPSGNQPKRVTYALADDVLTVTVETERGGKSAQFSLTMKRQN